MNSSDFYKILNVNNNATKKEIKQSYKKLTLKYHPDKNMSSNAPILFRKVQIAYETLSDDIKRKKYDDLCLTNNSSELKYLFMTYHELIIEICDKYELTNDEKEEIIALFDPKDFEKELSNNDLDIANIKLVNKIWRYIPIFMAKKMSIRYPYLEYAVNYIAYYLT